ncbi:uncharacterized protein JCM15063_002641 [Sporobolomyces koalae]|uniref:uncharacterized protein n=1 Tax=Sporobolomyces koalae TaxID=500713 RepID=UPI00317F11A2
MQLVELTEQLADLNEPRQVLESITERIAKSKKAVICCGAGISTNAGIPDFRSSGTGLYATPTASTSSSTLRGPAMFTASVYSSPVTTAQHLQFLSDFKDSLNEITANPPTATHGFLKTLKDRGQLRRVYTQNIDGLEGKAGLRAVELEGVKLCSGRDQENAKGKGKAKLEGDYVQLHGSISRVRCSACDYVAEWTDQAEIGQTEGVGQVFRRGEVAECPQCSNRAALRAAQRKRSLPSRSFLRPAITLYEENSPAALSIGSLSISDLTLGGGPDLLIVMGTSLKIPGFKKLVKEFAKAVKAKGGLRILVNREEIKGQEWRDVFDYNVLSDSDLFTSLVLSTWKRIRPRDWVGRQSTLFDSFSISKTAVAATSSKKRDASGRPPLRSISSNTLLPPLPPLVPSGRASANPGLLMEGTCTPPTKRFKPTLSPLTSKSCSSRLRRTTSLEESSKQYISPHWNVSPDNDGSAVDDLPSTPPTPSVVSILPARVHVLDSEPTSPIKRIVSNHLRQPFKDPLRRSTSLGSHITATPSP